MRSRWDAILIVTALLVILGASIAFAVYIWRSLGAVPISTHGYVALGLGVGLSLLVGWGLMALVFFSNRSGHDEQIQDYSDIKPHWRGVRSDSEE